jgi:hypothetical protein
VDLAVSGDEAITIDHLFVHAEIMAMMTNQLVGFFKSAFIEQQVDAFPGRELSFGVLARAALVATAGFGRRVTALQFFHAV